MKNYKIVYLSIAVFLLNSYYSTLLAQSYFQQEVNYNIDVSLNDVKHELSGSIEIKYKNNSPDTLPFIWFHLWPNAYKNRKTAFAKQELENGSSDFYYSDAKDKGYINSINFKIDQKTAKWEYHPEHIDICKLWLNKPLMPGDSILISTPFYVKIPGAFSRFGHVGQAYQITQWYPKPAVYDNKGWHAMPYLDQGEFYSEFGTFEVNITLPENYVVGATGTLMNEDEKQWLNKKAKETSEIKFFEKDNTTPPSKEQTKTLHYKAANVHDFAWFADKNYHVLKSEVELPDSKRKVDTWLMFTNKQADIWKNAGQFINDAIYFYSLWFGEYPYKQCTAVQGAIAAGGAMEYPMITVVGSAMNAYTLETMIVHEVGHNWFYGLFGFNERQYPWLDEGINSFGEVRYFETKHNKLQIEPTLARLFDLEGYNHKQLHELMRYYSTRQNIDQPANLHSKKYHLINYGTIIYSRVPHAIIQLMHQLGEVKFDSIMHLFYDKWKFKHPQPVDFEKFFRDNVDTTQHNINWFFKEMLPTTKKQDYKALKWKKGNNQLLVRNNRRLASPISVSGIDYDNNEIFLKWYEGFHGEKVLQLPEFDESEISHFVIDYDKNTLDLYRKNNTLKAKGLFKKVEPLKLSLTGLLENPSRTKIGFLPALGWNNYNKFMLGAFLYSPVFPFQRAEYQILPFYAFGNNDFSGSFRTAYTFFPGWLAKRLQFEVSGLRYAYDEADGNNFHKLKIGFDAVLRKKNARSSKSNHLLINTIFATKLPFKNNNWGTYYNFGYTHNNKRTLNPYRFAVNFQGCDDFAKATLEARYSWMIGNKLMNIDFDIFAGAVLQHDGNLIQQHQLQLSGTNGASDYTFDHVFMARYEPYSTHYYANQFIKNQGGFAMYAPVFTDDWLTSVHARIGTPKFRMLKLYGGIATFADADSYIIPTDDDKIIEMQSFCYELGIELAISPIASFYFPLTASNALWEWNKNNTDNYWQRIRFSLRFNKLNLFKQKYDISIF